MASKARLASIMLAVCAVLEAVAVIAQRAGSTHPPVLITVLTAVAAVLTAAAAVGLSRAQTWSWPAALAGAVLSALLAVGAILNAPVGAKIGAGVIVVLSVAIVVLVLPLRAAGRVTRA
ncbi:MAG: hypothetical protein NVSMB55_09000 [Mycobacteriales bacterium]